MTAWKRLRMTKGEGLAMTMGVARERRDMMSY
jgi:hypothetical protein